MDLKDLIKSARENGVSEIKITLTKTKSEVTEIYDDDSSDYEEEDEED